MFWSIGGTRISKGKTALDTFAQISGYAKIAVPFLAMIYAGALMYTDGPKDRSAYYKQMLITAPPTAG